MAKSRKRSYVDARPASALRPDVLRHYRRAAREVPSRELVKSLRRVTDEYGDLAKAGEDFLAMGAALDLIDVALKIAATPSEDQHDWDHKSGFFERLFPSMAETVRHPHAARVALAAVAAERARWAPGASTRSTPRPATSPGRRSAIEPGRLAAFAVAALTFHDTRSILAGIREVCAHHSALRREGRDVAATGAMVTLAECVRRACATAASSKDEAEDKIDLLARLKDVFHGGNGEMFALTGAMVDAAIAAETEAWLPATSLH